MLLYLKCILPFLSSLLIRPLSNLFPSIRENRHDWIIILPFLSNDFVLNSARLLCLYLFYLSHIFEMKDYIYTIEEYSKLRAFPPLVLCFFYLLSYERPQYPPLLSVVASFHLLSRLIPHTLC